MPLPWRMFVIGALLFALFPLAVLLAGSVQTSDGLWSMEHYRRFFQGGSIITLLNSLTVAGATTLACLILGVPIAILITRGDLTAPRIWLALFSMPLALPSFVLAQGWFRLLGRQGSMGRIFGNSVGEATSSFLFSIPGAVLVLTCALLPIMILLASAGVSFLEPNLEDAARLSASWRRVLWHVTLPLARPAIITAAVLTFLLAIGDYGAPAFLRVPVFPVESFAQISAFYDPGAATAAWSPLLLIVVICVVAGRKSLEVCRRFDWNLGESARIPLGRWRAAASFGVGLVAMLMVVLPAVALVEQGASVNALRQAWHQADDSLIWSALDAGFAASLVCMFGFLAARAEVGGLATFVLLAVPGPLLAFAMAVTWNRPLFSGFYGSPAILISALAIQYVAVGASGFHAALEQLPPSLEAAAEVAGAGWFTRTRIVIWPLVRQSGLAVWLLTFVLCLRDTSLALQLSSPGRDPLTARTLTLAANGSEQTIAALCLFSIALAVAPLAALWVQAFRKMDTS